MAVHDLADNEVVAILTKEELEILLHVMKHFVRPRGKYDDFEALKRQLMQLYDSKF